MNVLTKAPLINHQLQPVLPSIFTTPFKLLPEGLYTSLIVRSLNALLNSALIEGELDFLQNQTVSVEVNDLKLKFALSLHNNKLISSRWLAEDDLNLSGCLYDYMLLASRQEDSDTLFFQRRLKMEGNTVLGLEVKNLLDGIDTETVRFHKQLDFMLHHGINLLERLF